MSTSITSQNEFKKWELIPLDAVFDKPLQISSAYTDNGKLIMVSEVCGEVFTYNKLNSFTKKNLNSINFPNIKSKGIEGVCFYKNLYFFANERIQNSLIVINSKTKNELKTHYNKAPNFPKVGNNTNGFEGIEIDKKSGIIYIICEGKYKPYSELLRMKIESIKNDTVFLKQLSTLKVAKKEKYRYCALAFDASNNLLLLRSNHKIYGEYHIDKINNSLLSDAKITPIVLGEITKDVNTLTTKKTKEKKKFANNFEGLAYANGYVFVVSDNKQSDHCNTRTRKKTMLIKIKL